MNVKAFLTLLIFSVNVPTTICADFSWKFWTWKPVSWFWGSSHNVQNNFHYIPVPAGAAPQAHRAMPPQNKNQSQGFFSAAVAWLKWLVSLKEDNGVIPAAPAGNNNPGPHILHVDLGGTETDQGRGPTEAGVVVAQGNPVEHLLEGKSDSEDESGSASPTPPNSPQVPIKSGQDGLASLSRAALHEPIDFDLLREQNSQLTFQPQKTVDSSDIKEFLKFLHSKTKGETDEEESGGEDESPSSSPRKHPEDPLKKTTFLDFQGQKPEISSKNDEKELENWLSSLPIMPVGATYHQGFDEALKMAEGEKGKELKTKAESDTSESDEESASRTDSDGEDDTEKGGNAIAEFHKRYQDFVKKSTAKAQLQKELAIQELLTAHAYPDYITTSWLAEHLKAHNLHGKVGVKETRPTPEKNIIQVRSLQLVMQDPPVERHQDKKNMVKRDYVVRKPLLTRYTPAQILEIEQQISQPYFDPVFIANYAVHYQINIAPISIEEIHTVLNKLLHFMRSSRSHIEYFEIIKEKQSALPYIVVYPSLAFTTVKQNKEWVSDTHKSQSPRRSTRLKKIIDIKGSQEVAQEMLNRFVAEFGHMSCNVTAISPHIVHPVQGPLSWSQGPLDQEGKNICLQYNEEEGYSLQPVGVVTHFDSEYNLNNCILNPQHKPKKSVKEAIQELIKYDDKDDFKRAADALRKNHYIYDVNAVDRKKRTILHKLLDKGDQPNKTVSRLVRFLLQIGADITWPDVQGRTPLHYATQNKFDGAVLELLQCGASGTVADNQGKTPAMLLMDLRPSQFLASLNATRKCLSLLCYTHEEDVLSYARTKFNDPDEYDCLSIVQQAVEHANKYKKTDAPRISEMPEESYILGKPHCLAILGLEEQFKSRRAQGAGNYMEQYGERKYTPETMYLAMHGDVPVNKNLHNVYLLTDGKK